MQTQDITKELESVLSSIDAEGKEPSVALVKARLAIKVPMPAIISTLNAWKARKKVPKIEIATTKNDDTHQRIAQLEKQVESLTERLSALETKITSR